MHQLHAIESGELHTLFSKTGRKLQRKANDSDVKNSDLRDFIHLTSPRCEDEKTKDKDIYLVIPYLIAQKKIFISAWHRHAWIHSGFIAYLPHVKM